MVTGGGGGNYCCLWRWPESWKLNDNEPEQAEERKGAYAHGSNEHGTFEEKKENSVSEATGDWEESS